ncbi:nucleoside 2-deoxyribosyltransferase [Virgibacillus pantothenticus]|uniref:nucleoside 2-deoxyribosyltransferase n=1 Tax=Virgibacillus pantothenticus TaxID=1473 RepID=UPI0009847D97|nr:nucleoside 2-deoxyribosyltransferase [Virgibacillus pantothenticus]
MTKTRVYLAGDMLKRGSQLLREQERNRLAQIPGISVHNPADDEEINDKSRSPRAEDIFRKDTEAILESDVVIFDADDDSVGTTTEIGQVWGVNYMHRRLTAALINSDGTDADFGKRVRELLQEIPFKETYWQCTDIRNVPNVDERGLRRSYSLNQYLYGCLLDLAGDSSTFDEIVVELSDEVSE